MTKKERQLKERIKDLEKELSELRRDRDKFRDDLELNLKNAINTHGEGKHWNMSSVIEMFAKQMRNKQWWYW